MTKPHFVLLKRVLYLSANEIITEKSNNNKQLC